MKQIKVGQLIGLNSGVRSFFPMCIMFFCMVFFSSTRLFGDSPRTTGTMQPGQRWGFYKSGESYSRGIWDKVGYEKYSGSNYGFYESGMVWNLTSIISQSATITSCQLTFHSGINLTGATSNGSIVFTGIPWNFYDNSDAHEVYDQIINGPSHDSIAINTVTQYTISLPTWISDIQEAVQSNTPFIGLGAYNSGPPLAKGTSLNQVYLTINYTLPIPAKPTNLRRTLPTTALSFTLAWDAPTGEVTGYKVYKNGSYYATTASTNLLITELCPNTSYSMYIIPYNSHGDGDASSTVNLSTLAYSITTDGEATVCSSTDKTFTFFNRPSGVDINWTKSDNLAYVSGQGTDSYVVRASSSGSGWVQAALPSSCGTTTLQSYVWVGSPSSPTGIMFMPNTFCLNQIVIALVSANNPIESGVHYEWRGGGHYYEDQRLDGSEVDFTTLPYYPYTSFIFVKGTNTCGSSAEFRTFISVQDCGGGLPPAPAIIFPNPASNEVTITVNNKVFEIADSRTSEDISKVATKMYTIRITDFYGALLYSAKKSGDSFTIPISSLKNGQYYLYISNGKNTTSLPLMVKH